MRLVILWTDMFVLGYFISILFCIYRISRNEVLTAKWTMMFSRPIKLISLLVVFIYLLVALCDSIHFQRTLVGDVDNKVDYSLQTISILDLILEKEATTSETTYSSPFAVRSFVSEFKKIDGESKWVYENLEHVSENQLSINILLQLLIKSVVMSGAVWGALHLFLNLSGMRSVFTYRFVVVLSVMLSLSIFLYLLSDLYHILGTDKVGKDVLYSSFKSIRTGLIIGVLTTAIMVPIAVFFGVVAGYYRGLTDDIIQYVYTTISSIPGVLLIAASVLTLQLWLEQHQDMLQGYANRVEMRLLLICFVLGLTSWPGLCRLIRAETMKISTLGYIEAAKALNVPNHKIIIRHIVPNVMYLIIVASVMDISGLVLAESVLSYVGVGVDPSSYSWGNMINSARMELSRTPVVWWTLLGAFVFMFVFVVAINEVADTIRDIYEPRTAY